jgi:hypothetical protein
MNTGQNKREGRDEREGVNRNEVLEGVGKDKRKGRNTHLLSTLCRSCPTSSATCAISTTEFCSSKLSYNEARCERIVGSDESSGFQWLGSGIPVRRKRGRRQEDYTRRVSFQTDWIKYEMKTKRETAKRK